MIRNKIKKIKYWVQLSLFCLLVVVLGGFAFAKAAVSTKKVMVGYFGQQKQEIFDKNIKPVFLNESCKTCELVNFTPDMSDGKFDVKVLIAKIESLPEDISFIFINYNMKVTDENKQLVELLNKKAAMGIVIVGAAGSPASTDSSSPLSRTVLGQVKSALIIGELGERDRLMPTAFYGPEMLTAIRPPKDKLGQGYSPLIFAANLAENWQKRSAQEWPDYLKKKKSSSRKLWLDINDMF